MKKLLASIARNNEEDDVVVQIGRAIWSGKSLQLQLALSIFDSINEHWNVTCKNVYAYNLCDQIAIPLDFTEDHPVLWRFKQENASAYFNGAPKDAHAAIGALLEAHWRVVGNWIDFGDSIGRPQELSKLLACGNGLLARGPIPLLNLYKETLGPLGVETYIRFQGPPKVWDGSRWREVDRDKTKALLLGPSFVIGRGWTAEQKS